MLFCLSASHKNTSLPLLESLNIPDEDDLMRTFCSGDFVKECIILQTCHRVEIYCVTHDSLREDAVRQIMKSWSTKTGVSLDIMNKVIELYEGKETLTHLFYLASGLESVVLGEDQILGQVRSAYVKAKENGTVGLVLDKVFMKAINTGRQIRTETKINEGSVSISSAAVDLAARELGDLKLVKALVIGAGEAGSIVAETLKRRGTQDIIITNRTYEKGLELAKKVSGKATKFSQMLDVIPEVDLVVAAVSVTEPILKEKQVDRLLAKIEYSKKIMFVDISQPRAVEETLGSIRGVSLKNIEDLKGTVEKNLRSRQVEAEKAKEIINEELRRLERELSKLFVEPLISGIYRRIEEIRQKELKRAIGKMGESDERKLMILDRFSRELIERVTQIPIEQLRAAALNNDDELLAAAEKIFRLKR